MSGHDLVDDGLGPQNVRLKREAACSFVQTAAAFKKHGCPNCTFLEVRKFDTSREAKKGYRADAQSQTDERQR